MIDEALLSGLEVLRMAEYLSRDDTYECLATAFGDRMAEDIIKLIPIADVQPLSVVAEHIKNRLYETAFNTSEAVASSAIADMAERIDFWIDELKDVDTNG